MKRSERCPVRYFVEEKLVFFIESTEPTEPDNDRRRESLQGAMSEFITEHLELPYNRVIVDHIAVFDRQAVNPDTGEGSGHFKALAFATVEGLGDLDVEDPEQQASADKALIDAILSFQAQIDRYGKGEEEEGIPLNTIGAKVTAVSPDWLATIAAEQDGTGGPGGRPVAWADGSVPPAYELVPDNVVLENQALSQELDKYCARGSEQDVDVAILDTAPSRCVLDDAYRFWGAGSPGHEHPLVDNLLKPGRLIFDADQIPKNEFTLWVCYANQDNYPGNPAMTGLNNPTQYGVVVEHQYRMPDHGLFVAGVIHSLAPHARLFLIQVINDWGICSLQSITAGLEKLVEVRTNTGRTANPLVVNLSLVLGLPRKHEHLAAHPSCYAPEWWELLVEREQIDVMSVLAHKLTDILSGTPQALIVAAAGNDQGKSAHASGQALPKARYPAAFKNVTGVGAYKDIKRQPVFTRQAKFDAEYTPYSNEADEPENKGFITFGGQIEPGNAPEHAKADKNEGMLGIYTGDFPDGTRNRNGWARWCGTSFATPVITGLIANRVCAKGAPDVTAAEDQLRKLVDELSLADAHIVPLHQPV